MSCSFWHIVGIHQILNYHLRDKKLGPESMENDCLNTRIESVQQNLQAEFLEISSHQVQSSI